MNDELYRRPARDVDPDQLPDYGFGGEPLFRDEVPPAAGEPGLGAGPGDTGFHDASLFRGGPGFPAPRYASDVGEYGSGLEYGSGGDYGTGIVGTGGAAGASRSGVSSPSGAVGNGPSGPGGNSPSGPGGNSPAGPGGNSPGAPGRPGSPGAPGAPGGPGVPGGPDGAQQWAPNEGPLRVVPAEQASALLRIKLPDTPPVPATTLRSDAPIETVVEAAQMLHHVSPARPNALPGDVLALTTATMVVPMPGAAFGGVRAPQRSARLTASVPPDLASRAEADLLSDTVEQFFGDFDAIGRELEAQRAGGAVEAGAGAAGVAGVAGGVGAGARSIGGAAGVGVGTGAGTGAAGEFAAGAAGAAASQTPAVPGQYAPAAPAAGR
ncbi:MAG: hypothetical protein HOW97_21980, partial [Catenulispora sp.]|nr:hypothetical protein [Catenulispora sp.]